MVVHFSGVYEIQNLINGKRYIGSSCNVDSRLWHHKNGLRRKYHYNQHLQRAYDKHGESNFSFKPLLFCDPEMTLVYEQMCIDSLKPEYNIAVDACASAKGRKFSEEHRRKLSEAGKGIHFEWLGRRHSEETKRKMSESAKGRIRGPMSDEQKQKLSQSIKGRTRSDEVRKNMSDGAKKRWAKARGEA